MSTHPTLRVWIFQNFESTLPEDAFKQVSAFFCLNRDSTYSLIFVNENKTNLKRTQLNSSASNHKPNLNYMMHVQLTLRGHVSSFDFRNSRKKCVIL